MRKSYEDIYRYPLRQTAVDTLNRQLRSSISDEALAQLVIALRDDDRLCIMHEEDERQEPRIICSMGLMNAEKREKQDERRKARKDAKGVKNGPCLFRAILRLS